MSALDLSQFIYDPVSRRYRNTGSGQYISAKSVRSAVDTVIDAESTVVASISQQLIDGSINLAEWQIQMSSTLKTLYVAMGVAANGGFDNMSNSDLGYLGSLIKKQYEYLRNFANDVKQGRQPLSDSFLARADLYVQAARTVFEDTVARSALNGGATQEKSILGSADHCNDCVGEAAKDWSPIGTLLPIGDRQCMANCHCSFAYS